MFVRSASAGDFARIPQLVEAAFGRHDEGLLVEELRRNGDIVLEFVATDREELIGHIIMSKMVSPDGCLALAPLSVHPDRQGKGIGSALVRVATEAAEEQHWTAAFVLGEARYYGRFGYEVERAYEFESPYPSESTGVYVFDDEKFRSLPRELIYPSAF